MSQLYNQLYDILIIGASKAGLDLCEQLLAEKVRLNIALISKDFSIASKKIKENITCIEQEVIYTEYYKGLTSLTLDNRSKIHGKIAVVATGTKPIELKFTPKGLEYNLKKAFSVNHRSHQAAVFGKDSAAVTFALELAKKFKYVYLCSDSLELMAKPSKQKKLAQAKNILHLPNCSPVRSEVDKDGTVFEVHLDTYGSLKVAFAVISNGVLPDWPKGFDKMFKLDQNNALKVNCDNQSSIVPSLYAIGGCSSHNTKQSIKHVAKLLLINLGGVTNVN